MNIKTRKIINLIFAVLIVAADIIYILNTIPNKYIIKTTTSALFLLCGVFNFFYLTYKKSLLTYKSIFMLVGLFFAFLGDVLLIDYFVIGACLFAIGHLFFLAYFIAMFKFKILDLLISSAIFVCALLFIVVYPHFNFDNMLILIIVYALIISFMLGTAIGTAITHKSKANVIMTVGAFLFFFSDLMLLFDVFTDFPRIFGILCLATYYPAEYLLAITISKQYENK